MQRAPVLNAAGRGFGDITLRWPGTLVHNLMTGEDGARRAPFLEWLRQGAGDGDDGAGLLAKLGMTAEQLNQRVAAHQSLIIEGKRPGR